MRTLEEFVAEYASGTDALLAETFCRFLTVEREGHEMKDHAEWARLFGKFRTFPGEISWKEWSKA